MSNGSVIIIRGGSCEIDFDHGKFKVKGNKHTSDTLKIKRIVISGDKPFDSNDITNGFSGEIRISVG